MPYNTFGIDADADLFTEVTDVGQLAAIGRRQQHKYILGGGSNILLTGPVHGMVLLNRLKGISVEKEDAEHVWLRVSAGEVWHGLVMYTIENGWGGLENLALIPGTAGAAPMQNIGAYGVEARSVIDSVTCWHWQHQALETYTNSECLFGYRDSIFKQALRDKVFITSVLFRLNKHPEFNTSYGAIEQELAEMGITELSVKAVAQAVINIRSSKLPDPAKIGNAGSFFKNPTIPLEQYKALKMHYDQMPHYPVGEHNVKVPAGWLIEQCGWKGYREGDAGVHARQALVIVNYGHARGSELWALSDKIVASVRERYGITLEREVQVW